MEAIVTPASRIAAGDPEDPSEQLGWMDEARCAGVDVDVFFPEPGISGDQVIADICGACPVRATCRAYALEHRIWDGIWGGTTPNDRKHLARGAAA